MYYITYNCRVCRQLSAVVVYVQEIISYTGRETFAKNLNRQSFCQRTSRLMATKKNHWIFFRCC